MGDPQRSPGHRRSAEGHRIFGFEFAACVDAKIKFATLDICDGDIIRRTSERSVARRSTCDNAGYQHDIYRKRDDGTAAHYDHSLFPAVGSCKAMRSPGCNPLATRMRSPLLRLISIA